MFLCMVGVLRYSNSWRSMLVGTNVLTGQPCHVAVRWTYGWRKLVFRYGGWTRCISPSVLYFRICMFLDCQSSESFSVTLLIVSLLLRHLFNGRFFCRSHSFPILSNPNIGYIVCRPWHVTKTWYFEAWFLPFYPNQAALADARHIHPSKSTWVWKSILFTWSEFGGRGVVQSIDADPKRWGDLLELRQCASSEVCAWHVTFSNCSLAYRYYESE